MSNPWVPKLSSRDFKIKQTEFSQRVKEQAVDSAVYHSWCSRTTKLKWKFSETCLLFNFVVIDAWCTPVDTFGLTL